MVWKQPSEQFSPAVKSTLKFETSVTALKFVKLIVILVPPRLDEMVGMHRCTSGAVVGNCTYENVWQSLAASGQAEATDAAEITN